MKQNRQALPGIISIAGIYIFITVLILFFANQILQDVAAARPINNGLLLPLAVILPLFLLGTIGYQFFQMIKDRRAQKPGSRFKLRLLLFFLFVSLISSIPQATLSIFFINTVVDTWFNEDTANELEDTLLVSLAYKGVHEKTLADFAQSVYLPRFISEAGRNPEQAWRDLQRINSLIDGFVYFSQEGDRIFSFGESASTADWELVQALEAGPINSSTVSENTTENTILEYVANIPGGGRALISTELEANIFQMGQSLTENRNVFLQLNSYTALFRISLLLFYGIFSVPIILLSLIISITVSDQLVKPIINLENATKRVSEGDYSFRILSSGNDDFALLIRSFNQMITELERSRNTLIQTEKVSAWQEIAQRLAHEIKNPLTPITLSTQRLSLASQNNPERLPELIPKSVEAILREVDSLNRLLKEFRDFSRLPKPTIRPLVLRKLLIQITAAWESEDLHVNLEAIPISLEIQADRDQITRALSNLIHNAIEAMNSKGEIQVFANIVMKGNANYCRIQIQDSGVGIDSGAVAQVFNPYFTTKESGTGLGLAIVERIINDHHGTIWFETEAGIGTTFFIDLPWSDA
jgi:two-component system nitrogen regulation sensor histidine kinase NtrY